MNTTHSHWHLLGAGSLGCLFAAYLRRAGVALDIIVRDEESLHALHRNGGITLSRNDESRGENCSTIAVGASTADTVQTPIQQLLVCTKAQQTLTAIATIKSRLAPDAVIVLLQNGMGVRELLQRDLLQDTLANVTILNALSTEGAFRTQRFHVTHAGFGETVIGSIDPEHKNIAQRSTQSLQCERPINSVDDIEYRLWLKLAVNSVINPLTALNHCRNGELLQLENIDAVISELCAELGLAAQAEHIAIDPAQMRDEIYRVIHATAQNKSSMLQDIEAQRSTEIDFINGFIVERARAHVLPCTAHERLLQAVRSLHP